MPQPFNNAIMTNVGARLLTKAQAGEIKIEFIRVEVGNGNYTEDEKTLEALQSQTALKSMKNSYPISDIEVYNDYSVKVTALISNQDSVTGDALITAGYYINEMGLYAKEKDGTDDTEVLYSIAVTAGDNGDFMPPYNGYNPAQIIQDYFATVNNSAEITIQTSGAVALAEDLFEVRKDIELLKRNGAANGYSTETEYHAGEYCIYNNTLYRCLKDTSGEWDPESWEMTNPMEEIGQLKKSIDSLIGLFGRDEEGNMKSLGEAAFAGISHNFLTEEDAGMVAGADLLKLLKEQVDSQNSASSTLILIKHKAVDNVESPGSTWKKILVDGWQKPDGYKLLFTYVIPSNDGMITNISWQNNDRLNLYLFSEVYIKAYIDIFRIYVNENFLTDTSTG